MLKVKFIDEQGNLLYELEIEVGSIIPVIGDTVWLPNQGNGLQVAGRHIAYDDFYRCRLAESKGSHKIYYEVVLCMVK